MKISAAVFLCMTVGVATAAAAANVPVRPAKKAGPVVVSAATTGAKVAKPEASAAKGNAALSSSEAFGNPYETPLLLNARPLMVGRP